MTTHPESLGRYVDDDNDDGSCDVCGRRSKQTCDECRPKSRHCIACCLRRKFARGEIANLENRCARCREPATHMCAGCRGRVYCSRRCQAFHWMSVHSRECREWKNSESSSSSSFAPPSAFCCGVEISEMSPACIRGGRTWGADRRERLMRHGVDMETKYGSFISNLGSGSFGTVDVMRLAGIDSKYVAVKAINMDPIPPHDVPSGILHEMEIRNLDDVGVVGTCAAAFTVKRPIDFRLDPSHPPSPPQRRTTSPSYFVMVMDVALGGTAMDVANQSASERFAQNLPGAFSPNETKFLAYQLVRAVAYLHSELILTLDMKPENVLVFGRAASPEVSAYLGGAKFAKRLAITDLGLSRGLYAGPVYCEGHGALGYMSPEALLGCGLATHAQDVWGTACTLYEIATADPFLDTVGTSLEDIVNAISEIVGSSHAYGSSTRISPPIPLDADLPRKITWFPHVSYLSKSLKTIDVPGARRQKMEENLAPYPGLAKLLWRMLEIDPSKRCTIFDALQDPYFDSEVVRIAGLAFPEIQNPNRTTFPLSYEPDTMYVDCQVLIEALRSKLKAPTSPISGAPIPSAAWYVGLATKVAMIVSDKYARGTPAFRKGMAVEARAQSLLREYVALGRVDDKRASDEDLKVVAAACCLLADKYQSGLRATLQLGTFGAERMNTQQIVARELDVLKWLDFDVMRPTTYDFYSALTRGTGVSDAKKSCVWDAIRVLGCDFAFSGRWSPYDVVLGCIAARDGGDEIEMCPGLDSREPYASARVDKALVDDVVESVRATLKSSIALSDLLEIVDVDAWTRRCVEENVARYATK